MDYRRCLEIQRPYLGPVNGYYTDWTPLRSPRALSPRISTPATLGSSGTCSYGEGFAGGGQQMASGQSRRLPQPRAGAGWRFAGAVGIG